MFARTVRQHHRKLKPHVTKKQVKPARYKMTSSNNNNYMSKCYLNLFEIVLTEIGSINVSLGKVNDFKVF